MTTKPKRGPAVLIARLILLALLAPLNLWAQDSPPLRVAVAANFLVPMEDIARLFSTETGIELQIIAGSTGKLYAQIKHGAPFDVFLAADSLRPRLLFEQGMAGEPLVYAKGKVRLWSKHKIDAADWQEALSKVMGYKIAIPSPETAPYGKAAREALQGADLWNRTSNNLIYGQSVAQTFQFAVSGGARAAFVSASYTLSKQGQKGYSHEVPRAGTITQKGCLILSSTKKAQASRFLAFITSQHARPILQRYGYE